MRLFCFFVGHWQAVEHLLNHEIKRRTKFFYFCFWKCFNHFNPDFNRLSITIFVFLLRFEIFLECPAHHLKFLYFRQHFHLEFLVDSLWVIILVGLAWRLMVVAMVFFRSGVRFGVASFIRGFPFAFHFKVCLICLRGWREQLMSPMHKIKIIRI